MSYSSLADVYWGPTHGGYTKGRTVPISKITVHCFAGCGPAVGYYNTYVTRNSEGDGMSANYAIGNDGKIGVNVDEEDRAWTSSSSSNDNAAITIEVSNCEGWENMPDIPLDPLAYEKLILLCADICRRYNIKLYYDGTPDGTLTYHRMFSSKSCPGDWMVNKSDEFCKKVNALASGGSIDDDSSDSDLDLDDDDYSNPTAIAYDYYLITSTEKSTKPGECGNKITGSAYLGRW